MLLPHGDYVMADEGVETGVHNSSAKSKHFTGKTPVSGQWVRAFHVYIE